MIVYRQVESSAVHSSFPTNDNFHTVDCKGEGTETRSYSLLNSVERRYSNMLPRTISTKAL